MEIDKQKLEKISKLEVRKICRNEEEVKMKIIKPILESLGYDDFDYESDRSDIFVSEKLLLEAKNHNISLDKYVSQLERYWNIKKTRFAILCNGIEFRVYHPFWPGKKFEETLIKQIQISDILYEVDFLINCLSNNAFNTGKAKQWLREIEDLEDIEKIKILATRERKNEIELQLEEIEIEKQKQIDSINKLYSERICSFENELSEIEEFLNLKKQPTRSFSPLLVRKNLADSKQPDSINDFSKVEVLDKVNYFGLIEGKQIMFCTGRTIGEYIVLWCKEDKSSSKYSLSTEGQKFSENKVFNQRSSFIGKMTYLSITKNTLDLWNELYEENLFPFWDPESGPFTYNENNPKRIALCQVFKSQVVIEKQDVGPGRTSRTLKNSVKIEQLENDLKNMTLILPNQLFLDRKNKIETIINKYK